MYFVYPSGDSAPLCTKSANTLFWASLAQPRFGNRQGDSRRRKSFCSNLNIIKWARQIVLINQCQQSSLCSQYLGSPLARPYPKFGCVIGCTLFKSRAEDWLYISKMRKGANPIPVGVKRPAPNHVVIIFFINVEYNPPVLLLSWVRTILWSHIGIMKLIIRVKNIREANQDTAQCVGGWFLRYLWSHEPTRIRSGHITAKKVHIHL